MKKLLTVLFILSLGPAFATTYYVRTDGNDGATGLNNNNNSTTGAWLTLAWASTHVTTGDLIFLQTGTFTATSQITIPPGVSVRGIDSATTTLKGNFTQPDEYTAMIAGVSAMGTNGNQEFYNLKFDGNNLFNGWGLQIQGRSNVNIHNCWFVGFLDRAILLTGRNDGLRDTPPTVYATGCKINKNRIDGCARFNHATNSATGAINIGGLIDFQIMYDTIITKDRPEFYNGFPIKNYNDGYIYKGEIAYCYLEKAPLTAGNGSLNWDFCFEGSAQSEINIHHNTFINGGIDFNRCIRNGYAYGTWIHDNVGRITTKTGAGIESFITFDYGAEGVKIENNDIKNYSSAVLVTNREGDSLIDFVCRNNIFDSIYGNKILDLCASEHAHFKARNIQIYNNFMHGDPAGLPDYSFNWPWNTTSGNLDSFYFVGNDIKHVRYIVRQGGATPLNYFILKNNNIRDSTDIFSLAGSAITNLTNTGNYGFLPTYDGNKVITAPSTLLTGVTTTGYPFTPNQLVGYYYGPDVTPPAVISTSPASGTVNVNTMTTVTVNFGEDMDVSTFNASNIFVTGKTGTVSTASSTSAVITFSSDLSYSTVYTINVQNVKDAAGNTIASPYTGTFTTVAAPTIPTVPKMRSSKLRLH